MNKSSPNHVSFNGQFNTVHTPAEPAGKDIIEKLECALIELNIQILSKYNTDYNCNLLLHYRSFVFGLKVFWFYQLPGDGWMSVLI